MTSPTYSLITGASSGIGLELAKQCAADKRNLILVARRNDELQHVKKELEETYQVDIVIFPHDLSQQHAAKELHDMILSRGLTVDMLINNAGFGDYGMFVETDLEKELNMIDLNIKALTELTKHVSKGMKARGSGYIMNVASTAAFQPGPLMAVYFATKTYVLSFSEAIANELAPSGVYVTALCPGPTDTKFQDRAFGNESFFKSAMTAEAVAKIGYAAMMKKKRVVIPGLKNKLLAFSVRFTPRNIVTAIARKMFEK